MRSSYWRNIVLLSSVAIGVLGSVVVGVAADRGSNTAASQREVAQSDDKAPLPEPAGLPSVVPAGEATREGDASSQAETAGRPHGPASVIVKEVGPPVYWLPDAKGQLQPVINWSFEEFARLRTLQQGLAASREPPAYTLVSLRGDGRAGDQLVELRLRIEVRVDVDRWVKVPLRLTEATLHDQETYEGPGSYVLGYEPSAGYTLWLRGRSEQPHRVELPLLVPLRQIGVQRVLHLTTPPATASQIVLRLDEKQVEVEASDGLTVKTLSDEPSTETTAVELFGTRGSWELRWRPRQDRKIELPREIEAIGQLLVRIDSRSVSTVANLHIESRGAPLTTFRVRLPAGARLVAGSTDQYRVEAVPPPDADKEAAPLVEVHILGEPREALDLRLVTEQLHDPAETDQFVDLAGFEVFGAVRQSGHLTVTTLGDWQLVWGQRRNVRQVAPDELPETMRQTDVNAAFEYLNQPARLQVRITPRRSRVSVSPQYVFLVDGDRVLLHARMKYTIRGARVFALNVRLPELLVQTADDAASASAPGADPAGGAKPQGDTNVPPRGTHTADKAAGGSPDGANHDTVRPGNGGPTPSNLPGNAQKSGASDSRRSDGEQASAVQRNGVDVGPPQNPKPAGGESSENRSTANVVNNGATPSKRGKTRAVVRDVSLHWEIGEIGPPDLVDLQEFSFDKLLPGESLAVKLLQPVLGEVELLLDAQVAIPANTTALSIALPSQPVNTVGPASVVIAPADNVELTPKTESIEGLSRATAVNEVELPLRQQPALFFRGRAGGARFTADFRVRQREIVARTETRVTINRDGSQVRQRLMYEIAYEPLDHLLLRVPRTLIEHNPIRARLGGQTVSLAIVNDEDHVDDSLHDDANVMARVALPRPRIGNLELTLEYPLPAGEYSPSAGEPPQGNEEAVDVPLVLPAEGRLVEQIARVTAEPGIYVKPRGEAWVAIADDENGQRDLLLRPSQKRANHRLPLAVSIDKTTAAGSTFVDRMWVQSWVGRAQRQDRVAFQCTTTSPALVLRLPSDADEQSLEALVDGNLASIVVGDQGVRINLPQSDVQPQRHLIELRYRFRTPRPAWGTARFATIALDDPTRVRRMYWQLVLPGDEHLVLPPREFTSEHSWVWRSFYWGRQPLLDQFDLEAWVGAPHRTAPSRGTNQYLFSSLELEPRLVVVTAARWVLVLAASGAALIVGLLLIYAPAARQPGILLAGALLVASAGLVFPEPTVLVAQAASFGILLTVFARLLQRATSARPTPPLAMPGSGLSDHGSAGSRPAAVVGSDEPTQPRQTALQGSASSSEVGAGGR